MKKIGLYVFAALVFFFLTGIQETEASARRDYSTGTKLLEQGRVKEAIPYLERAVAESTNASNYRQLAEAYKLTNQFQKAAETLYADDLHRNWVSWHGGPRCIYKSFPDGFPRAVGRSLPMVRWYGRLTPARNTSSTVTIREMLMLTG